MTFRQLGDFRLAESGLAMAPSSVAMQPSFKPRNYAARTLHIFHALREVMTPMMGASKSYSTVMAEAAPQSRLRAISSAAYCRGRQCRIPRSSRAREIVLS